MEDAVSLESSNISGSLNLSSAFPHRSLRFEGEGFDENIPFMTEYSSYSLHVVQLWISFSVTMRVE